MYDFLGLTIKLYNPIMDIFLYLSQFITYHWIVIIFIISLMFIGLFLIYKKSKLISIIFLTPFIWGLLGIFSLIYFVKNYNRLEEIKNIPSTLKTDILGNWCSNKHIISINNNITFKMAGENIVSEWTLNRNIIQIKNLNLPLKKLYIVKFNRDLFLSSNPPSSNYDDLEYKKCD